MSKVKMGPVVVIPAYEPKECLLELVSRLTEDPDRRVIVVDDGSSPASARIFEALRGVRSVRVLRHAVNLGKGRALKTAFNEFLVDYSREHRGVVTVDADGQHVLEDVIKVIHVSEEKPGALVLGARDLTNTRIPLRSYIGNLITRYVVRFLIGLDLKDTQTGLRAIPTEHVERFLQLKGERYEYEMNMLIASRRHNIALEEVPIKTIYIASNASSHFNPLLDSMNIYFLLTRFASSSMLAAVIDIALFMIAYRMTESIIFSVLLPRYIVGPAINFTINRAIVFKSKGGWMLAAAEYALLATVLGVIASQGIRWSTTGLGLSIFFSKIMVESLLFPVSFTIQRDYIFKRGGE